MQDRRSFLSTCGAALLGAACSRAGTPPADQRLDRIGVQLYTARRDLARDFEGTLARIAEIGYREVEFAGYHDKTPSEVRAVLTRLGLAAPSSHVAIEVFRRDIDGAIAAATHVGHRYLVVPWLDPAERRTIDDYRRLAEELNRFGEKVRAAGMQLGYHNHDFELAPIGGSVPLDVLIERTDPNLLVLELDLYWVTKGGADPLTYFSRTPGRVQLVHVKDSAGAPEHRQVDVGQGTIDFKKIFARREQAGIRHAFVEHDDPANPIETLRVSYEYLSRLRW
jgi:sugar phosphate isomerase/epimerase